jgi:raffinose/stachyose/melibiose transport system permease protein
MDFLARDPLFFLFLIGLMVPGAALIVPLYQLNVRFGLMNSYPSVIGPYVALGLPFSILLLRTWFRQLPRELEEAALVDGATRWTIYWRIFLPLSGPALTTVGIFEALAAWNDFLLPLLFFTDGSMRTLPLGIITFETTGILARTEHQFALLVLMSLPVVALFLFLQRQFISGLTAGAVKG